MEKVTSKQVEAAFNCLERLEVYEKNKEKKALLEEEKDNPVLQTIFKMALGQDRYFIHPTLKLSRCTSELSAKNAWGRFLKLSEALKERRWGSKKSAAKARSLFTKSDPVLAKWLLRILDHDLRVGVGPKTITAVFGFGFLTGGKTGEDTASFQFRRCMLGLSYKRLPKKHKQFKYPKAGEYKLDGERALIFVFQKAKKVIIVSRANRRKKHIENVGSFTRQFLELAKDLVGRGENVFIDGEFLAKKWNKTSSVVSSYKNFDEESFLKDVRAIVWDWAPLEAYETGTFEMPWEERKLHLLGCSQEGVVPNPLKISPKVYYRSPNIGILGHKALRTEAALHKFYNQALDRRFEGAMIKSMDAPMRLDDYRGPDVIKFKAEEEATGVIVRLEPGEKGKNGPADPAITEKIHRMMNRVGRVKKTKYYLQVKPNFATVGELEAFIKRLKKAAKDSSARRIHCTSQGLVTFRHSARLRRFIVRHDGKEFAVGGGLEHKGGSDQRMELWKQRKDLVGVKIDFLFQKDPDPVAVARFNQFVRIRHDLS